MDNENKKININDTMFDELREIIQGEFALLKTNLQIRNYLIDEFDISPELAKKFTQEERKKWDERDTKIDMKKQIQKAIDHYDSIIRDPKSQRKHRLAAQKAKDSLMNQDAVKEERDPDEIATLLQAFNREATSRSGFGPQSMPSGKRNWHSDERGIYDPVLDEEGEVLLGATKEDREAFEKERAERYYERKRKEEEAKETESEEQNDNS